AADRAWRRRPCTGARAGAVCAGPGPSLRTGTSRVDGPPTAARTPLGRRAADLRARRRGLAGFGRAGGAAPPRPGGPAPRAVCPCGAKFDRSRFALVRSIGVGLVELFLLFVISFYMLTSGARLATLVPGLSPQQQDVVSAVE